MTYLNWEAAWRESFERDADALERLRAEILEFIDAGAGCSHLDSIARRMRRLRLVWAKRDAEQRARVLAS